MQTAEALCGAFSLASDAFSLRIQTFNNNI